MLGFLDKFSEAPLITVSAFANSINQYFFVGNPILPGLIPNTKTPFSYYMSLKERLINFYYYYYDYKSKLDQNEYQDRIARQVFGPNMTRLDDLEKRTEIFLVNLHPSIDFNEPLMQNVIPVGGLQIGPVKDLPQVNRIIKTKGTNLSSKIFQDLREFAEGSKKGLVLFSLGTNVRSTVLGKQKVNLLFFVN